MNRLTTYRTIRFRRWNRVPYAVFASLHRSVSIGRLRAELADASMSKNEHCDMPKSYTMTLMVLPVGSEDCNLCEDTFCGITMPMNETEPCPENKKNDTRSITACRREPMAFSDMFILMTC